MATTVVANTQAADTQLSGISAQLAAINGSTVTATVKVQQMVQAIGGWATSGLGLFGSYNGGNVGDTLAGYSPRGFAAGGSPGVTNIRGAAAPSSPYEDNLLAYDADGRPLMLRSDEWVINGRVSSDLGADVMAGINAGAYDRAFFEKASTYGSGSQYTDAGSYHGPIDARGYLGIGGAGNSPSSQPPVLYAQVFVGNREITDIVDVRISETPMTGGKWRQGQQAAARA